VGAHVAALLQRQFLKLRGCPAALAGSQTVSLSKGRAIMQQQQQQQQRTTTTKQDVYPGRGALQALADKNVRFFSRQFRQQYI
jgi:hypothetical protein